MTTNKRTLKAMWAILFPRIEFSFSWHWQPIYRFQRWLKKTRCDHCHRFFRDFEEGSIGGENLCGKCCEVIEVAAPNIEMQTTPESKPK